MTLKNIYFAQICLGLAFCVTRAKSPISSTTQPPSTRGRTEVQVAVGAQNCRERLNRLLHFRFQPPVIAYPALFQVEMSSSDKPPKSGGLSLYAHLLDSPSTSPGSISGAPVTYRQANEASPDEDEAVKKPQTFAGTFKD